MRASQTSLNEGPPPGSMRGTPFVLAVALSLIGGFASAQTPQSPNPPVSAPAQTAPNTPNRAAKPVAEAGPQAVPGFWDPRRRPERPDLSRLTVIRFLTETDYPP